MQSAAERAEYNKEWKRKNYDKYLGYARKSANAYYRNNKEKILALNAEKRKANPVPVIIRDLLRGAQRRAEKKSIACTISAEDIKIPEMCPLLGIPLFMGDGRQCDNSPTLDRIDNSGGYTPDNVWVISLLANRCKNSLSADQIILVGTRLKEIQLKTNPQIRQFED